VKTTKMQTIILNSDSKSNLKLLVSLAKKLGINVKVLSEEEQEDLAFFELIENSKTGDFVSEESIFKQLKK
jgi:hypothetical protein